MNKEEKTIFQLLGQYIKFTKSGVSYDNSHQDGLR